MGQVFEELRKVHPDWTDEQIREMGWKILETRRLVTNMLLQHRNVN